MQQPTTVRSAILSVKTNPATSCGVENVEKLMLKILFAVDGSKSDLYLFGGSIPISSIYFNSRQFSSRNTMFVIVALRAVGTCWMMQSIDFFSDLSFCGRFERNEHIAGYFYNAATMLNLLLYTFFTLQISHFIDVIKFDVSSSDPPDRSCNNLISFLRS